MNKNIFFIKFSELSGERYDANTYHSERLEAIKKLELSTFKLKKLKYLTSMNKNIVTTNNDELPYIGLVNIESNTGIYLPTSEKETFSSAIAFKKGQVLFPKLRPYLNKVYFAEFDGLCSTEFHIFDSSLINNKFLAIFLQSNLVVSQTKYLMSGNTLPRLQTEDIENLLIPIPHQDIQNQIVLKMEQAYKQKEQKEKEAQSKLDSIDEYLLNELGIEPFCNQKESLKDRVFFRKFSELSGDRFDADYYRNRYYENIHYLNQNKNFKLLILGEISLNIFQGLGQNLTVKEENILLKVKNIMNDNKIDFENVEFIEDIPETKKLINGDIIAPFIGEAIKKYKFSVFNQPKNDFDYTVDNNTGVIRLKENYNSIYISAFFMSSIGKILIEQLSGGGGVPFLGSNSAKKLLVPIPIINDDIDFEKQNKIANYIQNLRNEAQVLKNEAIQIFEDARKEVEKMILGKSHEI